MESSVRDYVSENAYLNYKILVERFGTPEQIAHSCIGEMETTELLSGMKTKERIMNAVLLASSLIVLIWFGFCAFAYYEHSKFENGYATVEVEVIEQTGIIEEGE